MNKRKMRILDTYVHLLREFTPSQITVRQIVAAASIPRSTFYTYFDSKAQMQQELKEMLLERFLSFYKDGEIYEDGYSASFNLCKHIFQYRAYYHYVFQSADNISDLSNVLMKQLLNIYKDKDYAIFASYGTVGYLKNWIEDGFQESPVQASEKLMKIGYTDWASEVRVIINEIGELSNKGYKV